MLFDLLNVVNLTLLSLPAGTECVYFLFEFGDFLFELSNLLLVIFAQNSLPFNLLLLQTALHFIEFFGYGITFHTQLCGCFVHQINGFIRQETVGNVTLRKFNRSDTGIILYSHLMVVLISFL